MKRINNIYHQIALYDNLALAFYKASMGKKRKKEVIDYRNNLDKNLKILQDQIIRVRPDVGHYRFFVIRDPKLREICSASFKEMVLHHAIMNICEPVLDNYAIFNSYACRKNKGTVKAIYRCQEYVRKNQWYLKMDIKKYFDSINHDIAIQLLSHKFKEKSLIALFQKILDTYHKKPSKGVPICNLISQHLANYYLGPFDHWMIEVQKRKFYIRYMDDFIVFGQCKKELKELLGKIQQYLSEQLDLELKHTTQLNRTCIGVPFLGFRIFQKRIQLTPNSKKRFIKKFKQYESNYEMGIWDSQEFVKHIEPLFAFVQTGNTVSFRRNVINRFGVLS